MKCPKCNFENEMGSLFCSNCGIGLESISNDDTEVLNINEEVKTLNNNQVVLNDTDILRNNHIVSDNGLSSSNEQVPNNFVRTSEVISMTSNMNSSSNAFTNVTSIKKLNRFSNFAVIGFVALIAIITIGSCYLMTSNKRIDEKKNDDITYDNKVTINGRTGNVPDGWNFVSGVEIGQSDYESVFIKSSYDSFAYVLSSKNSNLSEIKANMYTLKVKLESKEFSNIDVEKGEKNGSEYVLFDGLYKGKNYHLLYLADTTGVFGSEGVYASKEDLTTIISFMTKLKKNVAIKVPNASENTNLFETILEK